MNSMTNLSARSETSAVQRLAPYAGLLVLVVVIFALSAFTYREAQPASSGSIKEAAWSSNCIRTTISSAIDTNHDKPLSNGTLRVIKEMCNVMATNAAAQPENDRLIALQRSALVN